MLAVIVLSSEDLQRKICIYLWMSSVNEAYMFPEMAEPHVDCLSQGPKSTSIYYHLMSILNLKE